MKYYNYSMYDYEVWGNKHDDFQVNNVFRTESGIVMSENTVFNDQKLIKALKDLGIIKKGIHARSIEIDGEAAFTLYFNDVRREAGGFCPAFELRCDKIIDTED